MSKTNSKLWKITTTLLLTGTVVTGMFTSAMLFKLVNKESVVEVNNLPKDLEQKIKDITTDIDHFLDIQTDERAPFDFGYGFYIQDYIYKMYGLNNKITLFDENYTMGNTDQNPGTPDIFINVEFKDYPELPEIYRTYLTRFTEKE
ncbi:MAG: hypothetical protein ACRC5M_02430, partial [Anaeroplasmataceae bacterium]